MVWTGTAGEVAPHGSPLQPDTPFFIASITKLFFVAVLLRLAERGEIDLDEPFLTYLTAGLAERLHVLNGIDRTPEITVRHLASHTSGLPDYIEDKPKTGPRLVETLIAEGDRDVPIEEVCHIVRERLTPIFPPRPLGDAVGVRARYSDTNFALLKAIIERVTGRAWSCALAAEILEPLGMRHTWVAGDAPLDPTGEVAALWGDDGPLEIPLFLAAVGDMYSVLTELIRFMRALVDGSVFADPQTGRLMSDTFNTFLFDPKNPRLAGWPIEYGLGMMRFQLPRWATPFGRVPSVVGHTGSTGCWLFHCPELDVYTCGTVSQISAGAVPFRTVPRLLRALM